MPTPPLEEITSEGVSAKQATTKHKSHSKDKQNSKEDTPSLEEMKRAEVLVKQATAEDESQCQGKQSSKTPPFEEMKGGKLSDEDEEELIEYSNYDVFFQEGRSFRKAGSI